MVISGISDTYYYVTYRFLMAGLTPNKVVQQPAHGLNHLQGIPF